MKLNLYIFLFFLSFSLQAQVTGLQGKRFSIEYQPHINLLGGRYSTYFSQKMKLEYVLSRHVTGSIYAEYVGFKTSLNLQAKDPITLDTYDKDYTAKVSVFSIGGELRSYLGNGSLPGWNIAPLGFYLGYLIHKNMGNYTIPTDNDNTIDKAKANVWSYGFSLGEKVIIHKNITFDYGMSYLLTRQKINGTKIETGFSKIMFRTMVARGYVGIAYYIF